jgi:CubicO group peptidase (beta-lactamase class C family)
MTAVREHRQCVETRSTMNRFVVQGLNACLTGTLLAVLLSPGAGRAAQVSREKQVDAIFSAITDEKSPGVAVLVRQNGRTDFERGYGVRELHTSARIDSRTNFRLASFTKQFTAMAIMLLVHDGRLSYDKRLTDVFPEFPAYGKTITIRNLLNHSAGLVDYEDIWDHRYPGVPPEKIPQIHDAGVLEIVKQQTGTKFSPGTKWEYSNSGYAVLAMVVEKISGKPFGDFLQERIFKPLGMTNTLAHEKDKNEPPNRAYGHTKTSDGWRGTDQSSTSAVLGDGGIYSSLTDLAKWDEALARHTLLSEAEMRAAVTPAATSDGIVRNADGKLVLYGFGWFLDPYKGHARMHHGGSTIGFRTDISRFVDDKLTIIILCNRADLDPSALAQKIADLYLGNL